MLNQKHSVAVIGNGWTALAAAGFLSASGVDVQWITGTGARVLFPLPSMEWGPGVDVLSELIRVWNLDAGELQTGAWLREFRNKAFRNPAWAKAASPEESLNLRNESLWQPECRVANIFEAKWDRMTLAEIDEELRKRVQSSRHVEVYSNTPVQAIECLDENQCKVRLASGKEFLVSQVIYADRWSKVPGIEGLPKGLGLLRKREPFGVLQASFSHSKSLGAGLSQGYYSVLHRSGAQETERRVWGHFSTDGMKSIWTLCLSSEEMEDNHEIAKKFRRIKGTLDKMFQPGDQGGGFLPEGIAAFSEALSSEQVRFEEEAFFVDSETVEKPILRDNCPGVVFLTDGYGPSLAFQQVGALLGVEKQSFNVGSIEQVSSDQTCSL